MSIIDSFIGLFVPHECLSCSREGALICPACLRREPLLPAQCYRCLTVRPAGRVCCSSPLFSTHAAVPYCGIYKDLLWGLKSNGMQAAVKPMAAAMKPYANPGWVLVPVPTASTRVRQRGYDQANLLARELSRQTGLPCHQLLARHGNAHQVGANRADRKQQLRGAYTARPAHGLRVLLIDDVMTTGATLEAAAIALRAAGAVHVSALTFARA